jgi:glycogen debranching enzyme
VSVISLYPWAAPSTRLALIAFPGLFLVTGRHAEGPGVSRVAGGAVRRRAAAQRFPEDGSASLYQGADVSLWFVYAAHQYLRHTGDEDFVATSLFHTLGDDRPLTTARARAWGSPPTRRLRFHARARRRARRGWTPAPATAW